jgi:hypothetical protein
MSAFDPNSFLDATINEALVKRPPIPVGDYIGVLSEPVIRPWVSSKDATKSGIAADYMIDVDVPQNIREEIGLDSPTIKLKYGIMLDTNATGGIDTAKGKNGGIRKFREALDMNTPGVPFNLRMVAGRPVKVKIGHREYPEGSGDLFEEVVGLAKV